MEGTIKVTVQKDEQGIGCTVATNLKIEGFTDEIAKALIIREIVNSLHMNELSMHVLTIGLITNDWPDEGRLKHD